MDPISTVARPRSETGVSPQGDIAQKQQSKIEQPRIKKRRITQPRIAKALPMAAPSSSIELTEINKPQRQQQPQILQVLQQVQRDYLTPHLLNESANWKQARGFGGEDCDAIQPTPERRAEKEQFFSSMLAAGAKLELMKKLSPENQTLVHKLGEALIDINTKLWQHNTQDNIDLYFRHRELQDFMHGLQGRSQKFGLAQMAGAYNGFKLAQASPFGLFCFAEEMTDPERAALGTPLPPFWNAAHQLQDHCQEVVQQAEQYIALHPHALPDTKLLAARFFLQSMEGASHPQAPMKMNSLDLCKHIAKWNLQSIQTIPHKFLGHPALLALVHSIERNEVIDPVASQQLLNQLKQRAMAQLDSVQTQFHRLTAHTPELKALIDEAGREAIAMEIKDAKDEVARIDTRPRSLYKSTAAYEDQVRRRQQRAENIKFYTSGSYAAYDSAIGGLGDTKTVENWMLDCSPASEFIGEFINYGEAGIPDNCVGHTFMKTNLLPEAVDSLGLNPALPRLLKQDIQRTQGVVEMPAPIDIQEIQDEHFYTPAASMPSSDNGTPRSNQLEDDALLLGDDHRSDAVPQLQRQLSVKQQAVNAAQRARSFLQAVVIKPAQSIGQRLYAHFFESKSLNPADVIGFDLKQRNKESSKLKAFVDLRTITEARVTGPTLAKVNKVKVIIGPNQQAKLSMRDQSRYIERTIVNQTPEPIVARNYWDSTTPKFTAKAKGGGELKSAHANTVVTLENLNILQSEGVYALAQDKAR